MPRLYLVRHGRAASSFGEAADPGLDETGWAQAQAVARSLGPLGPLALLTSPLKRARETSRPLARLWHREAAIETAVAEIPTPAGLGLAERAEWLRAFMPGSWRAVAGDLARWREDILAALSAVGEASVVFTHFIAINVAVGAAEDDDRVTIFRPDNGSVTLMDVNDGKLRIIERGRETQTRVN